MSSWNPIRRQQRLLRKHAKVVESVAVHMKGPLPKKVVLKAVGALGQKQATEIAVRARGQREK